MYVRFYHLLSLIILLLSFALRMADMPHGLPYVEHPDEPNFYSLANDVRGVRGAYWRNDWLAGYPPGYIWLYAALLNGVDAISQNNIHTDMGVYVGIMRIVSILLDMLTLSLIMVATRWLAGNLASLLAGGVWAVSSAIVQNAVLALPDPPTVFACVLCVVLALKAFRHESFLWIILATLAGLLATIFKYPVAPILLLPAAFCLWQLWRDLRRALLPSAVALVLVLLTVYGLFFIYGANNLSNVEANTVRSGFLTNLLEPFRWYKVFNGLFGTFGIGLLMVAGITVFYMLKNYQLTKNFDTDTSPPLTPLPIAWRGDLTHQKLPALYAVKKGQGVRIKEKTNRSIVLISLTTLSGFLILAVIPGYLHSYANSIYPIRYTLPAAAVLLIPVAALIGRVIFVPLTYYREGMARHAPTEKTSRLWMGIALALPMIALLPETIAYQTYMQRPLTYTAMQYWFEENIPENSRIWTIHIDPYVSLSRYDRGYSGFKNFDVVFAPNNIAENGITITKMDYLYLTEDDLWIVQNQSYPLVKHIGGTPYRGPDLYIYRAHPLPNPQAAVFTNSTTRLVLRGIQAEKSAAQVTVESYWQAVNAPDRIYSYSLYLSPTDDSTDSLAQMDGQLGHRPTNTWVDPEELLRGDLMPLTLPELTPGDYTVWLVLYSWETGERFVLADGTDRLPVLAFTVTDDSD